MHKAAGHTDPWLFLNHFPVDIVTKLNIRADKIWRNFQAVGEFKTTTARGRTCLQKCKGCEQLWRDTGSAQVHMAQGLDGKTNYICDTCLGNIDSMNK